MEETMGFCRYSIHFHNDCVLHSADFKWDPAKGDTEGPVWTESDFDGTCWHRSPLNKDGYDAILKHFGLDAARDSGVPTIEKIQSFSPANLMDLRRKLEAEKGLKPITAISDRGGNRIRAEEVGHRETADA
jgi:hypothetical protein